MTAGLPFNRDALAALCRRHRIRRLPPFGSVLMGNARSDSDDTWPDSRSMNGPPSERP